MDDIATLPYRRVRVEDEHDRRTWGDGVHLAECHYSGQAPDERGSGYRSLPEGKGVCRLCHGTFLLDADGLLVRHARMLDAREQAETKVSQMAALLGFDPWGDASVAARAAARDCRDDGVDLRVAAGMAQLQTALVKRGAAHEAAAALAGLKGLRVGDEIECDLTESEYYEAGDEEAPFFTESFLYPLLGKEAARSVLYRFKDLEKALGGQREDDSDTRV